MKKLLNERNIVALLFILVMISFSLAQEQSRSMQNAYSGTFTVKAQKTPANPEGKRAVRQIAKFQQHK